MESEYKALMQNNTWTLVPYSSDMHVVQNKWVFRTKYKADGSLDKFKTRLVAKGFQQMPGVDYFDTFSLVIKPTTIRVVLTLAVTRGWSIQLIDVNNAFLNGDMQKTVFIAQPEGFSDPSKSGYVCRLTKALYGLKQAPKAWYDKLKSF